MLLHIRLYLKAFRRYVTAFTQTVAIITIALVVGLAALLIVPLVVGEYVDFRELYWRIVVAVAILAAVGTALIPLVNVLFAPKKVRGGRRAYGAPRAAASPSCCPWPTYVDGVTPLPILPDGSPDWNAYYTGYPSPGAHVVGGPAAADARPPTLPLAGSARAAAASAGLRGLPAAASAAAAAVAVRAGATRLSRAAARARPSRRCARRGRSPRRRGARPIRTAARAGARSRRPSAPRACRAARRPRPTATTARRGRCRRRPSPSESSRSAVVRASMHGDPSGAS